MNIGRKLTLGMVSLSFLTVVTLTSVLAYNAFKMAQTTEQQLQTMFNTEKESNGKLLTEIGSDFTALSGSMGDLATELGRETAILKGESVGNQVSAIFAMATSTSQTTARLIEGYKADCNQRNIVPDRRFLDSVLNDILEKNPKFQSLWCVFGVNQLDGKDEEFKNSETSGVTGQYSPWYHRDNTTGEILHEFCADFDEDYFMQPYTTGSEYIDGPNNDNGTFIVGLCTPIKVNGETLGVVGVDLRLKTLSDTLSGLDLFETGYAMFISPKMIIAANTHSSAEAGTDIDGLNMEQISLGDIFEPQRFDVAVTEYQTILDEIRAKKDTAAEPGAVAEWEIAKEIRGKLPLFQKRIFGKSENIDLHLLQPVIEKIQKGETAYYGDESETKRLFPIAGRETIKIHVPIKIGESPIPWTMLIVVEKDKVMETSIAMAKQTAEYLQSLSGKFTTQQTNTANEGKNVIDSLQTSMKKSGGAAAVIGLGVLAVAVWIGIVFAASVNRAIDDRDHWYQQVLDVAPSPISVVDPHLNLTFVNEAAEKLLGQERQALDRKPWKTVWKSAVGKERTSLVNLSNEGITQTLEEFADTIWDVFCDRIVDRQGKVTGMVEICKDVTAHEHIVRAAKTIDDLVAHTLQEVTEISGDAAVLSQGAQEQTSYLQDIIAGMSEMRSKTTQNVQHAGSANDLTQGAAKVATEGQERMEKMVTSMHLIGETSKSTKEVIKTIESIAFQTNLLALNAAVEAARAGTHGKGFAVVAEEVRSLAARSATAAQQTSELLESSNKQIVEGVTIVDQMAGLLNVIVERVNQSTELVAMIAQASQEQANSVDSINHHIEQVNQVALHNTTAAKETDSATSQLEVNVKQLAELMSGMGKKE